MVESARSFLVERMFMCNGYERHLWPKMFLLLSELILDLVKGASWNLKNSTEGEGFSLWHENKYPLKRSNSGIQIVVKKFLELISNM